MKSILDPSFEYTPSVDTDIRKTFDRVRRQISAHDDDDGGRQEQECVDRRHDPEQRGSAGIWIFHTGPVDGAFERGAKCFQL